MGDFGGVVQDGAIRTLLVIHQALPDFEDGKINALNRAADFDDTFRALGQKRLGGSHAHTRGILDVLDFGALATNNCAHQIMGDQQTDRSHAGSGAVAIARARGGRGGRSGGRDGVVQQSTSDQRVGLVCLIE